MAATEAPAAKAGLDPQLRNLALVVLFGTVMTVLDTTVVNVAATTAAARAAIFAFPEFLPSIRFVSGMVIFDPFSAARAASTSIAQPCAVAPVGSARDMRASGTVLRV